jgi:phage N-6-adenine-methyltransferase
MIYQPDAESRDVWSTPDHIFQPLHKEFAFTLDVCALPSNAKCRSYYTPSDDGLTAPWGGVCWMNPPYGRTISQWMRKAWLESRSGATVVCLVPARTDTGWWHDYAMKGEIRFIRGRIHFQGPSYKGHNAPFPSAVVIFRPPPKRRAKKAA